MQDATDAVLLVAKGPSAFVFLLFLKQPPKIRQRLDGHSSAGPDGQEFVAYGTASVKFYGNVLYVDCYIQPVIFFYLSPVAGTYLNVKEAGGGRTSVLAQALKTDLIAGGLFLRLLRLSALFFIGFGLSSSKSCAVKALPLVWVGHLTAIFFPVEFAKFVITCRYSFMVRSPRRK